MSIKKVKIDEARVGRELSAIELSATELGMVTGGSCIAGDPVDPHPGDDYVKFHVCTSPGSPCSVQTFPDGYASPYECPEGEGYEV